MTKLIVTSGLAVLIGILGVSGPAGAGTVEERDGVPWVLNSAVPSGGSETVELEELWRRGGFSDAEEEFFGVLRSATFDESGNIYLLDAQLAEVRVFSPAGEYLLTMGREGEGPGEFRRPTAVFTAPGGQIAVIQIAPGRIVLLTHDGEPAGEFSLPEIEGGGRSLYFAGQGADGRAIVLSRIMEFGEGKSRATMTLAAYGEDGSLAGTFHTQTSETDFANFVFRESDSGFFPWAAGSAGPVYGVPTFGEYEIRRWNLDGTLERVVTREFEHLARTDEEIEEAKSRFVIRGPVNPQIEVSDYHPDVRVLFPRADGTLWVMTSRGSQRAPEGSLGTFDVFDEAGDFVRQVTLRGEADPTGDLYFFHEDRIYVLRRYRDAFASMTAQGSDGEEIADDGEEAVPMEVICYSIP